MESGDQTSAFLESGGTGEFLGGKSERSGGRGEEQEEGEEW
jgi:hypothetical protein